MTRPEDLTEQEIARRVPVWTALAELYLDCERQEANIRWTADKIKEAGYTITEAKSFLQYEVGPVFFETYSPSLVYGMFGGRMRFAPWC